MSVNLTLQSPLMQPVVYQGRKYFTGQYFHRQYLDNSPNGGKYRQHSHFARLLRSVHAYAKYIQQGDIVELPWSRIKTEGIPNLDSFQVLFQANGWNPLTLISATFQIELSHHLDDEISQQMAVAASTMVARQMSRKAVGSSTPVELSQRDIVAWLAAAQAFGTPLHIAQQEGVKMIAATHGVDFRPLMIAAPAQDTIAPEEEMLEPSDLAKRFGLPHGAYVNQALEHVGWQVKQIGGGWSPTPAGTPYASRHAWTAKQGTKSGYNWKWHSQAVEQIFHAHGIEMQPPTEGVN